MVNAIMTAQGPGKVCTKCGVFKLREGGYHRDGSRPNGSRWNSRCIECEAHYQHEYYLRVRERKLAYCKAWRATHREHHNAYMRAYNRKPGSVYRANRPWSTQDDVFVLTHNDWTCPALAEELNRTPIAIKRRRQHLAKRATQLSASKGGD